MFFTVLLVGVIFLLIFTHLRGKYNHSYWKNRGVTFYEKNKSGGPFWQYVIGRRSLFEIFSDVYKVSGHEPAVGLGAFFDKALYVTDPINILHVTQTEFHSFNHRGIPYNDEDLLANNVLFMNGPKWKLMRQKLTPLFTGAKLKNMYYIIDKSAQDFVAFLKENPDRLNGNIYSMHDTISHFCTAAISAAVFGIGTKSTFDSPFRKMAKDAASPTFMLNLKFAIGGVSDELYKSLKLKLFGDHEQFFIEAMKQVIRQREQDKVQRHDFADMCVKLQENGTMKDPETDFSLEPTDEVLAAQAFFFFMAGIEPSAAAIFSTMMELGRHPDILRKVHEEVDNIFKKYNDQLSYDAVFEADNLDRALSETLRLYPPLGWISRKCIKDSVLPVGNIPVENGVKIYLPVYDIHHDPKYYHNPETFDPDRFLREGEVNDMTYLPFGKGHRICIGAKYSRLQVMSGLMHCLRHYSLKTLVGEGGIKFSKEPAQVRINNVDIELIPRNK